MGENGGKIVVYRGKNRISTPKNGIYPMNRTCCRTFAMYKQGNALRTRKRVIRFKQTHTN